MGSSTQIDDEGKSNGEEIREGRFSRAENGKWTRRDHGGRLSKKVISVSVSHGVT